MSRPSSPGRTTHVIGHPVVPPTTRLLVALALVSAVTAAGEVALGVVLARDRGVSLASWLESNLAGGAVTALAMAACGTIVVRHRSGNGLGWLLLAEAHLQAATVLASEWATGRVGADPRDPLTVAAAWVGANAWWVGLLLLAFLPLLFPDGRLPSRRWRPVAGLAAGAAVVGGLVGVLSGALVREAFPTVPARSPLGDLPDPLVAGVAGGAVLVTFGCGAAALVGLGRRLRRATPPERGQLSWFVLACLALVTFDLLPLQPWTGLAGNLVFGAALGVAVVRHRLYDGDRLLSRTLVYGLLTGAVLAVLGLGAGRLGSGLAGPSGGVVVTAMVVAVGLGPLHRVTQRLVDRVLYGGTRDPYVALREVGAELTSGSDDALAAMTRSVARALHAERAEVVHGPDETGPGPVTRDGDGVVDAPLVTGGRCVGVLRVHLRRGHRRLPPTDRALLADLTPQVAVAVRTAELLRRAERARADLLGAVEEERRRLRDDLHDGVGPALAGISLGLSTVLDDVRRSGRVSPGVLQRLEQQTRGCLAAVHDVVDGLRPSALDGLGLVGALHEHAETLSRPRGDFTVTVTGDVARRLPAAVELAAYRCGLEAMTNAAVHARARRCEVALTVEPTADGGVLHVEVRDDGVGLAATRTRAGRTGVGLRSMAERTAELGGSTEVDSSPDGTRVRLLLPVGTRP